MREREEDENRSEPARVPLTKIDPRERERRNSQRLAHRFETDPDNPTIVRGID